MSMRRKNHDKGSIAVIAALMMTVMLGCCALAVDVGMVYVQKEKLQSAIDAASLAAAQELPDTTSALLVANQYMTLNGFGPSDINVRFSNGNNTIRVTGNKIFNYSFARILGFDTGTISAAAAATKESIGAAFNYALFSGSTSATLTLNGSHQNVTGSSHTNKDFLANGSNITITGACEAVTTVTTNGSRINLGSRVPNAPYVAMPDFSDTIKAMADAAGQSSNGDKIYNGSNISVASPIYINGNLTVNGSHFSGQGIILVTGDITFNGSNLYQNSGDAICFYSKSGNITVNGSGADLNGIVYAPNGTITMNGSNQTVQGRVIGDEVTINGSHLSIISGSDDLKSLPSTGIILTE